MRAISRSGVKPYILEKERKLKPEDQTVFNLKFLTVAQEVILKDVSHAYSEGTSEILRVHFGLDSIENLPCDDGSLLKLERDKEAGQLRDESYRWKTSGKNSLEAISSDDITEISNAIKRIGELSEAELKN